MRSSTSTRRRAPDPGGAARGPVARSIVRPLLLTALAASLSACALAPLGNESGEGPGGTVVETVTVPPTGGAQGGVGAPGEGTAGSGAPAAPAADPAAATAAVRAAVDRLGASLPAGSGIALAPVGRGGEVAAAGTLLGEVAWSSIKVPLAIAALRADPDAAAAAHAALTVSDNAAAQSLWNGLGGGEGAASAVMGVLREGGDEHTVVPSAQLREGFTVFGQTQWSLEDQARFGAGLPCIAGAEPVLAEMAQVSPEQRWGLGRLDGARFKGGWGPSPGDDAYLARQFGVVPVPGGGEIAVAIAANAPDFGAATAVLDGIADAVAAELASVPGGECAPG